MSLGGRMRYAKENADRFQRDVSRSSPGARDKEDRAAATRVAAKARPSDRAGPIYYVVTLKAAAVEKLIPTVTADVEPVAKDIPPVRAKVTHIATDVGAISRDVGGIAGPQIATQIGLVASQVETIAADISPVLEDIATVAPGVKAIRSQIPTIGANISPALRELGEPTPRASAHAAEVHPSHATVHPSSHAAASAETAASEGWRCKSERRTERACDQASKKLVFHANSSAVYSDGGNPRRQRTNQQEVHIVRRLRIKKVTVPDSEVTICTLMNSR
jgi:hypothetical protein